MEGELNKVYPLPSRVYIVGSSLFYNLKCRSCGIVSRRFDWHQQIIQNVTQLTCPECGAVHSEMIKGDG